MTSDAKLSPEILQNNILEVANISEAEKDLTFKSLDGVKFAVLDLSGSEWSRLRRFGIYPEDSLTDILSFSIEYIFGIWNDGKQFKEIIDRALGACRT